MRFLIPLLFLLPGMPNSLHAADSVELGALDLARMSRGWGTPQRDRSITGKPLTIGGRTFGKGVGTHADSVLWVELHGRATRFTAHVGVDDGAGERGSVRFYVYVDDEPLFESPLMKGGDEAVAVDVDLTGRRKLVLIAASAGDGIDFDHADWAEARIEFEGQAPVAGDPPREEAVMLTPPPGPAPRINAAAVYGCRPGRPFLYRIPAQGSRPMRFEASELPEGIELDAEEGILRGVAPEMPGEYAVTLRASNGQGVDEKPFTIIVGDKLALTPPMGWNHWYTWYHQVGDAKMRAAGDAMIASGMADVGYAYVNIDDCWMRMTPESFEERAGVRKDTLRPDEIVGETRDAQGRILSNDRFPDMKGLTDYLHARGLKAGIYTSPGPRTCEWFEGAWEHEEIDAQQFADWGFDFLKYDWCSYGGVATGQGKERARRPYEVMGAILADLDRDIVFNLCQYGMEEVWTWGEAVGGHCWRTTGDLGLEPGGALPGFYHIGRANARHWRHARPGAWNDPDYLLLGHIGTPHAQDAEPQPTRLTPSEQYSYMSMWSLMAAPLIFSGDMERLDAFTLNVLCNPEVIAVNQDALGRQAEPIVMDDRRMVLAKPLADGSVAVGLFNLFEVPLEIGVTWEQLGLEGPQRVRDVWRHEDLGVFEGEFKVKVPRHGVMFVRVHRPGE